MLFMFCQHANAQSWKNESNLNHVRFESTAVQYKDDIYVFNGFGTGLKVQPTVEKYDAGTKKWSVVASSSVLYGNAVTHNGIVRNGNEVWIIGGRLGRHPGKVTSDVFIYNLETAKWRRGPSMPVPVAAGGAAVINNRIHWFGGLDKNANCDVANHYVYDLNMKSAGWQNITAVAAMPNPRNHFATVVHDGLIYAIGGQFGHDNCGGLRGKDTTLVHAFNPSTNKWVKKANLPAKQSHMEPSSFSYAGAIYIVGGEQQGNKVFRYDAKKNDWDTVLNLQQTLVAPVARVIDNRLYIASGGAPNAQSPTNKMVSTSMAPLLLPNATIPTTPSEPMPTETVPTIGNVSTVVLEAEYFDSRNRSTTHEWITNNLSGASNNASVITTPDYGSIKHSTADSPTLSYFAYFDQPGDWYVWIRGWGDTNSKGQGSSDSLHVGLNGAVSATADKMDDFPSGWNWSNSTRDPQRAKISIPAKGIHAVNLWMREDGLAVDKILLTNDPAYTPTGVGPVHFDGTSTNTEADPEDTAESEPSEPTEQADTEQADTEQADTEQADTESTENNNTDTAVSNEGLVAVEIEVYQSKTDGSRSWIKSNLAGASGEALVTSPNTGKINFKPDAVKLDYRMYFAQAGEYYVWLRGYGDTVGNEGKNDSIHVGLNNNAANAKVLENFPARWSWSNKQRGGGVVKMTIPSIGWHQINLWMREDGLALDKLLLVKDASFVPTGEGTAVANNPTTETDAPADNGGDEDTGNVDNDANELEVDQDTTPETGTNDDTEQTVNTSGTDITIEMENYSIKQDVGNIRWIATSKAGASGGSAMVTTPDAGKINFSANGAAMLAYAVNFSQPGNYLVSVRGFGDTVGKEGKSDSVYVGLNNQHTKAQALQNFPKAWTWSDEKRGGGVVTVSVPSAGTHTVNVWMREDGLILDQLRLTKATDSQAPTDNASEPNDVAANGNDAQSSGVILSQATWRMINTANGSKVHARHEAGGVEFQGKMYVLGGRGTRKVSVYDPQANTWTHKSASPIELNHFQPVVFGNKIWVIGAFTGKYPNETSVPHIYTYTPATDKWEKAGTIPQQRRRGSAGAVAHNGLIYIVAGNNNGHKLGSKKWFDSYNPATGEWKVLQDAPSARDHATVSVSNNKLVIAAGRESKFPNVFGNTLAKTDVYDFSKQSWSQGKNIPTQRAGTMTVTVGDEIIVIGGEALNSPANLAKKQVEAYNVKSNNWRSLQPLKIGRHGGGAAVIGDLLHVVSGSEKIGGAPESTAHEVIKITR